MMAPSIRNTLAVVLGMFVSALPNIGQAQQLDVRGTATFRSGLALDGGDIVLNEILVKPELTYDQSSDVRFRIVGQSRLDESQKLEPGHVGEYVPTRSTLNSRWHLNRAVDLELREAYAEIYAGDWFLRLGKQQVVWGQADGLRVLDQVNPFSFREFILGEPEDRRIPLWMVNAERMIGPVTLQMLWIPDHTYSDFPDRGVFAVRSPNLRPQIPEGLTGPVTLTPVERPHQFVKDDDFGARVTGFSAGWDWSLNMLYTYDDQQVITRQLILPGQVRLDRNYRRTMVLGGSASNAFGKATIRSEVGYSTRKFYSAFEPLAEDGVVSSGEISGVFGLDYQVDADTLVSGQVFLTNLIEKSPAIVRSRAEFDLSLLIRKEFLNDTLELEGLFLQGLSENDGMAQLSLEYRYTDQMAVQMGVDVFYGHPNGKFGQFHSQDRVTIGLEYGF